MTKDKLQQILPGSTGDAGVGGSGAADGENGFLNMDKLDRASKAAAVATLGPSKLDTAAAAQASVEADTVKKECESV